MKYSCLFSTDRQCSHIKIICETTIQQYYNQRFYRLKLVYETIIRNVLFSIVSTYYYCYFRQGIYFVLLYFSYSILFAFYIIRIRSTDTLFSDFVWKLVIYSEWFTSAVNIKQQSAEISSIGIPTQCPINRYYTNCNVCKNTIHLPSNTHQMTGYSDSM